MKTFQFTVKDAQGIHARPAGVVVSEAKKFNSSTTFELNGKTFDMKKLLPLMGSGLKKGDKITVQVCGDDEDECAKTLKKVLKENL